MITTYKHNSIAGYTADMNHETRQIVFFKTNDSGRRLFSLRARSWAQLCRQTKTEASDWVIIQPRKRVQGGTSPVLAPYIPKRNPRFVKSNTRKGH